MAKSILTEFREKCYDKMLEEERDTYRNGLVPFDVYLSQKKAEMMKADEEFFQRILNGYQKIINKIEEEV